MIALSTKLTLLVLLLPISIVAILDMITYYFYGTLIIEASNLLSSILVFLLVWERLRDSLSKKMDYLEDNIFLDLHSLFRHDYDLWYDKEKEIKPLRTDLGRYGKFLVIRLFPIKLLEKIDDFLLSYKKFLGNVEQILGIVKQNFPSINIDSFKSALFHHLGFDIWYSPSEETEIGIIAVVQSIEKDQIVSETKALHEKVKKMRKQIYEEFEDFLKHNNLKLEKELVSPFR
jgi:hypothetical protein